MATDLNTLRELLAAGAIGRDDVENLAFGGPGFDPFGGAQLPAPARVAPPPVNTMRNEATGAVRRIGPPPNAAPTATERAPMRVFGVGGGMVEELGAEPAGDIPIDYSRPSVDIGGLGKGYYSRDGRFAVGTAPDGTKWKAILGYDPEGSRRLQERQLAMEAKRAQIAQAQESVEASRAARTVGRVQAPQWSNELSAWVLPPSADNPRGRVLTPEGAAAGNPLKASDDEKRSAGLAVRMELALRQMANQPGGARPQFLPEALRNIPLVGEMAANAVTPYERQTVEAAQLDALDAALTLATGAAYTKEQLRALSKSYFPQLNDDAKTVEDKKARLASVIETARIRAGRMAPQIDKVLAASSVGNAAPASALPPPESRIVGRAYDTPRGKAVWLGNGRWRID